MWRVRSKIGVQIPIPRLATEPSPTTQRTVGAGLVPAQCLSQSRRTISATAGMNSPPYYSHPNCGLHPMWLSSCGSSFKIGLSIQKRLKLPSRQQF